MNKIKNTVLFLLIGAILICGAYQYRSGRMQQDIADKILRFHVIANSDKDSDQQLKLQIRDSIGEYLHGELKDADDLEECISIVNQDMDKINQRAQEVIAKEGYDYPVQSAVSWVDFPVKTYGEYTFPAGSYQALQVVIGNGQGRNWWCVMYPNMCFSNSMYEVIDENSEKELKKVLTQAEYKEIMAEGKVHVKLKYLEKCKDFLSQLEK